MDKIVETKTLFAPSSNASFELRSNEIFQIGNFCVNLDKAYGLIKAKQKVKVFDLEITGVFDDFLINFPEMQNHYDRFVNGGGEVNLELPLLMIYVRSTPPEQTIGFIVDGWLRIFKARKEGVKTLPCLLLNKKESRSVVSSDGMHYKKVRL